MTSPDDDRDRKDDDEPDRRPLRSHRTTHVHDCANGCGTELACAHDRCDVDEPWICPTCQDHIDEQLTQARERARRGTT